MQRKGKKDFHRFLERRRQRLRRPGLWSLFWAKVRVQPRSLLPVLWPPLFFLALYGLVALSELFTPLYPSAHAAALLLFLLWFLLAARGVVGFWPRWRHAQFALVCAAFVAGGSCWGMPHLSGAKAWVSPPAYARLPSEPLAQGDARNPDVLAGSVVHVSQAAQGLPAVVSFAGQMRELEKEGDDENEITVSFAAPQLSEAKTTTLLLHKGWRRLGLWHVRLVPDLPPRIAFTEEPAITPRKTIRFAYEVSDDYGVEKVFVRVTPGEETVRRGAKPIDVVLTLPGVKESRGAGYADLTSVPWTGGMVKLQLVATDGAGHESFSAPKPMTLPARVFRNPFAKALIEERQKLLGLPDPAARDEAANVMAGIARQQGLFRGDSVVLMALRAGAVRLVLSDTASTLSAVRDIMWQVATRLEEGTLGMARAEFASAERDLSSLVLHGAEGPALRPFLDRLGRAMETYFDALEAERAKQSPSMQEVEWPLSIAKETLTREDLRNQLKKIETAIETNELAATRAKLDQLQATIENLRTTPPELTPDQYKLVEQTASLRALVREQKKLVAETEALAGPKVKGWTAHHKWENAITHLLAEQQRVLSGLRAVVKKIVAPPRLEAKASEKAMQEAIQALQAKKLSLAQQKQAEALALMENSLLALSEQMRQSLTAEAP